MIETLHHYEPRGAARELMECRADEVLLSGPAGTGKSRGALEKLHLMMLLNPGAKGLIVRQTAVSLTSTALETWRTWVAPEGIDAGTLEWYGGSGEKPASYRYRNGSVVVVGGMDKATKIMSSDYDVIYVQEAIELTLNGWEALTTRLRNGRISFQQMMADTNPAEDTHWLNQRARSGQTLMLESRHQDNPILFDETGALTERGASYMARLDALSGVRRLRLRDGLWVTAEGVIWEDFDRSVHLVDSFDIPKEWRRWWAVDFGFRHPFVLGCWAEDPDGKLYLYREIYMTGRLVEDHARDILAIVAPDGRWTEPKPAGIICDHDAEDRATLERHLGMTTQAAHKSVSDGLQAVAQRFKSGRLFICRNALVRRDPTLVEALKPTCTAEEIPAYVWSDSKTKEAPVKEDDDGCDQMRYLVASRDLRRRSGTRGWL